MRDCDHFDRAYFRESSAYARLGEPAHAVLLLERWYEGLFRYVHRRWGSLLPDRGDALDIGCGYGACLTLLARRGLEAYGVDVSHYAVDAARRSGHSENVAIADVRDERPFPGRAFDLVICFEVLEHLEEPRQGLATIAECLRPGAVAWLTTPNPRCRIPPYNPWADPTHVSVLPLPEWRRIVEDAGLKTLVASSFLHIPLTYRLGERASRVVPANKWGPTLLILARKT